MFLKTQLSWNVSVPASSLDSEGSSLQKAILIRLLDDFATKKTSKDLGYFLAITTLDKIGQGTTTLSNSGSIIFPVTFTCITFKMFADEILDGVVQKVMKHGVFMTCGPAEKLFLSHHKIGQGYVFLPGDAPCYKKEGSEIGMGTKLRFKVIAAKYEEVDRVFQAILKADGDGLGLVS